MNGKQAKKLRKILKVNGVDIYTTKGRKKYQQIKKSMKENNVKGYK